MNEGITLAACVDRRGTAGLEVLLASISHANKAWGWKMVILHDSLPHRTIRRLAKYESEGSSIEWHDLRASKFFRGEVVFGLMAYARILVPRFVQTRYALYMDTDMIVLNDLRDVPRLEPGKMIGAVQEHYFGKSNCKHFFEEHCCRSDTPYFNSGLLLIDCLLWRESSTESALLKRATSVEWRFPSGDQTLLNWQFDGDFQRIPANWNQFAYSGGSGRAMGTLERGIVHFIGRPKPWEMGGGLNNQRGLYRSLCKELNIRCSAPEIELYFDIARRILRYLPAYRKALMLRLKEFFKMRLRQR